MRVFLWIGMAALAVRSAADTAAPLPPSLPDAPAPAAQPFVPASSSSDYQRLRQVQQKMGVTDGALPADGAPREDMLLGLADAGARAASGASMQNLKSEDYDALYALLQKYRDELRAMGVKAKSMEDMLSELRRSQDEAERRIKNLGKFNFDGMKIQGHLTAVYDDEAFSGPGSPVLESTLVSVGPGNPIKSKGVPLRYRTTKEIMDLELLGARGPISGRVVIDDTYYEGSGSGNRFYGITRLESELRLPVVIQVAQYYGHMTPLTLWRDEDPWDDEPEPFASRRQRHRDDLYLKDNDVNMRGVRLATDLALFDNQVIHMQAMLHGVGFSRVALYYLGGYPLPTTFTATPNQPNTLTSGPYNTYLGAWQAQTTIMDHIDLGYAGTMMRDSGDSSASTYATSTAASVGYPYVGQAPVKALNFQQVRAFDSQVHSLQAGLKFFDGKLTVGGEFAESLYSNPSRPDFYPVSTAAGTIGYLTGTAMVAQAGYEGDWYALSGTYRNVDRSFVSAPAQDRSQDTNYDSFGPFMHENVHFNSVTDDYSTYYLAQSVPDPGLENFNDALLPPEMLGAPNAPPAGANAFFYNYLLPYNAAINPGSPYGLATPNRNGFNLKGSLKLFKGAFKPWAKMEQLSESSGITGAAGVSRAAETYASYDLGMSLDLGTLVGWPVSFSATYGQRQVSSPSWVSFNSGLYSAGAKYRLNEKTLFYAGMEHNNYSGSLAYPLYGAYGDPLSGKLVGANFQRYLTTAYKYNQSYDIWSLGMCYQLNEGCSITLDYGTQYFFDTLAEATGQRSHYEMDQGDARIDFRF